MHSKPFVLVWMSLWLGAPCHFAASGFIPSLKYANHVLTGCDAKSGSDTMLFAMPPFVQWWFQKSDDEATTTNFTAQTAKEAETMHRTAKMMEDHRRCQEAAERTAAIVEDLSSVQIVGKSKAGPSGGIGIGGDGRKGGVKVTFNGEQRPISVEVDPNYLFSSSPDSGGIISVEELNQAITDAMQDGYAQSGKLKQEKIKDLYSQLGLPRDPPPSPSGEG